MTYLFEDINNKSEVPLLTAEGDYVIKPSVGEYVLLDEKRYKVVSITIDYYKHIVFIWMEESYW